MCQHTFISGVIIPRVRFKQIISSSQLKGLKKKKNTHTPSQSPNPSHHRRRLSFHSNTDWLMVWHDVVDPNIYEVLKGALPCRRCSRCLRGCCIQPPSAPPVNDTAESGCHLWNVCAAGERAKVTVCILHMLLFQIRSVCIKKKTSFKAHGWGEEYYGIESYHPAGVA